MWIGTDYKLEKSLLPSPASSRLRKTSRPKTVWSSCRVPSCAMWGQLLGGALHARTARTPSHAGGLSGPGGMGFAGPSRRAIKALADESLAELSSEFGLMFAEGRTDPLVGAWGYPAACSLPPLQQERGPGGEVSALQRGMCCLRRSLHSCSGPRVPGHRSEQRSPYWSRRMRITPS
jgi:hypothetical protein